MSSSLSPRLRLIIFLQELTYIIKQDIASINKQIAALQSYVKQRNVQGSSKSAEGKQIDEHNHNVVMLLQSKLANTSMSFKDVLEVRTQVCSATWLIKVMVLNLPPRI
jgi:hypothetical protein